VKFWINLPEVSEENSAIYLMVARLPESRLQLLPRFKKKNSDKKVKLA